VILLWHAAEPVGVCVFAAPVGAAAMRSRYFGLSGARTRTALSALNEKVWVLRRVVLHPAYRGAGIATAFVRRACRLCPADWVEVLAAMGHANPVFERAGFARVGAARPGGPVYYVLDNRKSRERTTESQRAPREETPRKTGR
jgi:ABC-type ATPase with predicted acetyltransferase domain